MSAIAPVSVEVNWSADNVTWVDETANLLSCTWRRGRDYASQLIGRVNAGTLQARLTNPAGRYASLNTASALYGNIVPGRKVRLRCTFSSTTYTLWQGFLDEIAPDAGGRANGPTVTLKASGPLKWVASRNASTAVYTNVLTGTAIGYILDDAGWAAGDRTIDAGRITMARWKADGDSALSHLREIEETEFGTILESKDGKIVYQDVQHRLRSPFTTSQTTFSDASGAALSYDNVVQLDPWREVLNNFSADVQLYTVQSLATLWTLTGEVPALGVGISRDFWALYPTAGSAQTADHVDAWTTPVASTDMIANSLSGGGGTDLSASIGIAVSKFANSMKITLTNNAAVAAYITTLQARGTAVYKNDPIRVVSEDTTSEIAYGKRYFPLPGKFYPSTVTAQSYIDYGVSHYKDPQAILSLGYLADMDDAHMTQALSRDVSDRITVVANGTGDASAQLGISGDFFIEAETHSYDLSSHRVVYDLSDASRDAAYVIVPSGITVMWPSTNASIPADWSRVTALDGVFPKQIATSATNPGATGGSATHTHTMTDHQHTMTAHAHPGSGNTGTSAIQNWNTGSGSSNASTTSHVHAVTFSSVTEASPATGGPGSSDAQTSEPPYLTVIFISSSGSAVGIPSNALAYMNASAPSGWAQYAPASNRLMKGAATAGDGGATGGTSDSHAHASTTHGHTASATTHLHTPSFAAGASTLISVGGGTISIGTHTHASGGDSGTTADSALANQVASVNSGDATPPWWKLLVVQNGGVLSKVPVGIIGIWTGTLATVPTHWHLCDGTVGTPNLCQANYVRGAASTGEISNTGGTTTHTHTGIAHSHNSASAHTHTAPAATAGSVGTTTAPTSASSSDNPDAHTHTVPAPASQTTSSNTQTAAANANTSNEPAFVGVAYVQYTG